MVDLNELVAQLTAAVTSQQQQQQQLTAVIANQQQQMNLLMDRFAGGNHAQGNGVAEPPRTNTAELLATLSQRIKQKFDVDVDGAYSFSVWYGRYRDLFLVDGADLDDQAKVRLLLEQLSDSVHESYKRQVLPVEPYTMSFDETLVKLKELYDTEMSSFTLRYQCLKLEKLCDESLLDYTGRVNEACENAKVHEMKSDDIKCLLWIFGLKGSNDVDMRQRLLLYLDKQRANDKVVTLQALQKEAQRYLTMKRESAMIQNDSTQVSMVHRKPQKNAKNRDFDASKREGRQENETSNYREYTCTICGKKGHTESHCWQNESGDSRKSRRSRTRRKRPNRQQANLNVVSVGVSTIREYVDVRMKDIDVPFQLDTGADITLISEASWKELGSPKLESSNVNVQNYDGSSIAVLGKIRSAFELQGSHGAGHAYVTKRPKNILGLDWIKQSDKMAHHLKAMVSSEDRAIAAVELSCKAVFDENMRVLPVTAEEIRRETEKDGLLRDVKKFVVSGSPRYLAMSPFVKRRQELTIVNDCLMFNGRVVIPTSLRRRVLQELHVANSGASRTESLARKHAYWPNIDADCKAFAKSCAPCQLEAKLPARVPLQSWPRPIEPWQRIHIDFAGPVEGVFYLVVVDAMNKFPEVVEMRTISSTRTIEELRRIFARCGAPSVIVSDNGTQFTSELFKKFCESLGIQHIRSAPGHPQSKGQAERFVDTLKRGLRKLKRGEGLSGSLLEPDVAVVDGVAVVPVEVPVLPEPVAVPMLPPPILVQSERPVHNRKPVVRFQAS
jgi:transposase InsO family protein